MFLLFHVLLMIPDHNLELKSKAGQGSPPLSRSLQRSIVGNAHLNTFRGPDTLEVIVGQIKLLPD
jgi:hypothetical protein